MAGRCLLLFVGLAMILSLSACGPAEKKGKGVTFPDKALESIIRQEIDKYQGPIYASELETITSLITSSLGTMELTGLEYCTNLANLEFRYTQVDLSFLTRFSKLTRLKLQETQLSDISPLASLTTLTEVNLTQNTLHDISPLASLTNLTKLTLRSNEISDISALASLTNITELDLGRNRISDVSPLASLTNLSELILQQNKISDISALIENSGLSEGDTINLADNPLSDASKNDHIPQLEERGVEVKLVAPRYL